MRLRLLAALAAAWTAGGSALASEPTATIGAGGLVLARTPDLALERETLTISRGEITADYVFRNKASQDTVLLVAFPMPDLEMARLLSVPVQYPAEDPANFLAFDTHVEGTRIETRMEQRASSLGLDVTAMLRADGVPLNPVSASALLSLAGLTAARRAEYVRRGMAVAAEENTFEPAWTLHTTFYWEQVFPAGKPLSTRHRYRPIAGKFQFTRDAVRGGGTLDDYCLDTPTRRTLERRLPRPDSIATGADVQYVLTAGAHWGGPIGEFHLIVDKEDPDAVMSTCLAGLKKTGPTRFEVRAKDFTPEQDLRFLVVQFAKDTQ